MNFSEQELADFIGKGQAVNILSFAGQMVSVKTTLFCFSRVKTAPESM